MEKRHDGSGSSLEAVIHDDAHTSLSGLEKLIVRTSPSYYNTVAGGLAGATSAIVSCPLDVIKTKLQAQGGFEDRREVGQVNRQRTMYRGVKGTAIAVLREDGLKGFYRGLTPLLLGYVPTWAVYLTIYNQTRTYISEREDLGISTFWANVYASLVGGASSTTITNPIWVIKTRVMSQSNQRNSGPNRAPWQYAGTWDACKKMYRHEGLRSFYSGLTPALLGLTHVAVQFPLYEIFKENFTGIESGRVETFEERAAHFWGLASAVFLSKVVASTATYPHEVVRTRLQTQQRSHSHHEAFADTSIRAGDHGRPPGSVAKVATDKLKSEIPKLRGTVEICRMIYRQAGWKGFYAGLGTNLIRAVPSAMTTLLTFEYIKSFLSETRTSALERMDGIGSRPEQA